MKPDEATKLCIERLRRSEPYDDGGAYPVINLANALESGELRIVSGAEVDAMGKVVEAVRANDHHNDCPHHESIWRWQCGTNISRALAELDALREAKA